MAASFAFSESNGSGETPTDGISNLNMGDNDSANLNVSTYPIVAGNNSYEKNLRAKFGSTFTEISNMKFWKSAGDYVTGEAIKADEVTSYVQPVKTTSTRAVDAIPTEVGSAITVHSAAGGNTITAPGYTRYLCLQLQTTGSTPSGSVNQKTLTFQYDEI
jgi:hypothetical protein